MAISGLMITLSDDPTRAESALAALAGDPRLELGPREGSRVAAVADTPSPDDDRRLWDALHDQPGVSRVDVVYVGLDDLPTDDAQDEEPVR